MHRTLQIFGILGCLALSLAANAPAWATPQRNRVGNPSSIIADVDTLYNTCLNQCESDSVYRMGLESCRSTCAELRRNFPLLDKGYDSYADCAKEMDSLDLNRDTLARQAAASCSQASTHIHKRQGCREAVASFYGAATTEAVCSRQTGAYVAAPALSSASVPSEALAAQSTAAARENDAPPSLSGKDHSSSTPEQHSGVATDTNSVRPAPPPSPRIVSTDAASVLPEKRGGAGFPTSVTATDVLLRDTPKYQTPEEVARTLRRARGKQKSQASQSQPGSKPQTSPVTSPVPKTSPSAAAKANAADMSRAAPPMEKDAPAPGKATSPPPQEQSTKAFSAPQQGAVPSLPPSSAATTPPPPATPVPDASTPPQQSETLPILQDLWDRSDTPPPPQSSDDSALPTPLEPQTTPVQNTSATDVVSSPGSPTPQADMPAEPSLSVLPRMGSPENLPESPQPATRAPQRENPPPAANAPSQKPLSHILQIPSPQPEETPEPGTRPTLLPPTPSMLKQHEASPPTLPPEGH